VAVLACIHLSEEGLCVLGPAARLTISYDFVCGTLLGVISPDAMSVLQTENIKLALLKKTVRCNNEHNTRKRGTLATCSYILWRNA